MLNWRLIHGLCFLLALLPFKLLGQVQLMIEPYMGFHVAGKSDLDGTRNSSTDGFSLAARIGGIANQNVFFGSDIHHVSGKEKYQGGEPGFISMDTNELGLYFGYKFDFGLRLLLTYYLASIITVSPPAELAYKKFHSGQGPRLDVSYFITDAVNLTLGYRRISYSKRTDQTGNVETLNQSKYHSSVLILVGYVFSFGG